MATRDRLSQTMRIDLIPDTPSEAVAGKEKRIVVATPTRRHMRPMPGQQKPLTSEDAKYAELLQGLYDAAMITDSKGHIVDANLRANEFMLYSREEMNQLSIYDIVSGADHMFSNPDHRKQIAARITQWMLQQKGQFDD